MFICTHGNIYISLSFESGYDFQSHVSDFFGIAQDIVVGLALCHKQDGRVMSSTACVVSKGVLDSHSALPRLYRARVVLMFLFPDFLVRICSSSLRNSISFWALATTLS